MHSDQVDFTMGFGLTSVMQFLVSFNSLKENPCVSEKLLNTSIERVVKNSADHFYIKMA
jgi:hypothetical protein